MNSVILMGRLTADPELRYTPAGVANARFTVAVDRNFVSADNEKKTDFIRVTAWRKNAEFIDRYFTKGKPIVVYGSIQTGSYEKDGKTVYTTDVVADRVEFVVGDKASQSSGSGASQSQPAEAKPSVPDGFESLDDGDLPF